MDSSAASSDFAPSATDTRDLNSEKNTGAVQTTITSIKPESQSTGKEELEQDGTEQLSDSDPEYPKPLTLALLMLGICLAAFLVALDRTIIATAIPRITDEFDRPGDVGWYGSAYLLTSCAFQPTYGRVFADFDVRWSFVLALFLFELGSLICGVASSSTVLIVGRAIAGLGCAGIFAGCMVIISMSVPLKNRPAYMAIVGAIFGIGSVAGPLLGGAFTEKVSWRWCFYINLPVGAITLATLLTCFHPPKVTGRTKSFLRRLVALDMVGNLLIISSIIMLLLALQWGGIDYAWSSAQVVGLLVGSILEFVVFIGWQHYRGDEALIPLSMVVQRTVAGAFVSGFFLSGAYLIHSYYLTYWFQAVRGASAFQGGVDVVPYVVSMFICSIIAGLLVTKTGYFNPPAILGPALTCIGSGLFTTLELDSSMAKAIGYQILAAAGLGMSFQQGLVAVQAVLPAKTLPMGTAFIIFTQSLSGAIFVSVGNSVLRNWLSSGLTRAQLPGVDVGAILAGGATDVRMLTPSDQLQTVLTIYNEALSRVFVIAVPLAGLSSLTALTMEWRSIKGLNKSEEAAQA